MLPVANLLVILLLLLVVLPPRRKLSNKTTCRMVQWIHFPLRLLEEVWRKTVLSRVVVVAAAVVMRRE